MTLRHTVMTWRAAITDSDLPPAARHVALTLSVYMSEKGDSAFPGAARLARDTALSERWVRTSLAHLVERGWLEVVERGGLKGQRRRANSYRAVIPDPGTQCTRELSAPVNSATATPELSDRDPGSEFTPTRQELISEHADGDASVATRSPRGGRIPIPYDVEAADIEWVQRECAGLDWDHETKQFVDYWRAIPGKRGVKLDWRATWKVWMRRAHKQEFRR